MKGLRIMIDKRLLVAIAHISLIYLSLKLLNSILPYNISSWYTGIANIILFIYVANITYEFSKRNCLKERIQPSKKAVFITGCDSGFGHELAKRLDSLGFQVLAACLFPYGQGADVLKSKCSNRLQIVGLDVTKDESVKKALDFVKNNLGTSELWAVVNNAGILKGAAAEFCSLEIYKENMEVNGFGPVRVTKAFLPLLRKTKGRIVNVTSRLVRIPAPHVNPYVMSKCASQAFTDGLRQELDVWGISVISVEPDMFQSALVSTANVSKWLETSFLNLEQDIKDDYGAKRLEKYRAAAEFVTRLGSRNIQVVINSLEEAVCLKYPDTCYKPCRNVFVQVFFYIAERVPRYLVDLPFKIACYMGGYWNIS